MATLTSDQRSLVAQKAEEIGFNHLPYVNGAAGPDSYDDVGLAVVAWNEAELSLPHDANQLVASYGSLDVTDDNLAELLPGDLLFYHGPMIDILAHLQTPGEIQTPDPHVAVFIRKTAGFYIVAQATDTLHGTEIIDMRKYSEPTGLGLVR